MIVSVDNYLPNCSVRGGPGKLKLELEQYGGKVVRRVDFMPDTAIYTSQTAPPTVRLTPVYPDSSAHVGQPFRIGFTVSNEGQVAARDLVVSLASSDNRLRVRGRDRLRYSRLNGSRQGSFELVATKTGNYEAQLSVITANANQPLAEIGIPVTPPEKSGDTPWVWLIVGAVGGTGAAVLLRRRRRRTTTRLWG